MAVALPHPPLTLSRRLGRLVKVLDRWSVESQLAARRNAMVAMTALAQRRAEREEVEEFLAALARPIERHPPDAASQARHA